MKLHKKLKMTFAVLLSSLLLTGCIEEEEDDYYSDGMPQSSSSGSCSSYKDIVSSSEQSRANGCGIQVSSHFAQADSALSAAIASCQQGDTSAADQYYSNYEKGVKLGRQVMDTLCSGGGSSGSGNSSSGGAGFEDTSSQKYYNLCTRSYPKGGSIYYEGSCYGPFQQFTSQCESSQFSYLSNYSSSSSCITARDNWLNRQVN